MNYDPFEPEYWEITTQASTKAPSFNVYGDEDQANAFCISVNASPDWYYNAIKTFDEYPVDYPHNLLPFPSEYLDISRLDPKNIRNMGLNDIRNRSVNNRE